MWQFSIEERTTYNTHFLFRLWMRMRWASAISISIQVWGIASFIFFGFATTFLQISEISSTLEPNKILYFSDYQIIHSIFIVI